LSINRARTPGNNWLINKEFVAGLWAYFPVAWISSSTSVSIIAKPWHLQGFHYGKIP
jgi:hypothetical protein